MSSAAQLFVGCLCRCRALRFFALTLLFDLALLAFQLGALFGKTTRFRFLCCALCTQFSFFGCQLLAGNAVGLGALGGELALVRFTFGAQLRFLGFAFSR